MKACHFLHRVHCNEGMSFLTQGILHAFSRPARKDAANRNLLRQNFIAYIFRSQRAREQELYCLHLQEPERKSARALLLTSSGARSKSQSKSARVQECKSQSKSARVQELYCLHLQEQESKRARALLLTSLGARAQESKSSIAYIFRSQSTRAQESQSARVQECKRENGETPSLLRRIILRLGLVTP